MEIVQNAPMSERKRKSSIEENLKKLGTRGW